MVYPCLRIIFINPYTECLMKIAVRILAVIAVLVVLIFASLSLYLTDERLKGLVLPQVNETLGRQVQVDRMGYTLFRTFPRFGLVVEGFALPGDDSDAVVRFGEMLLTVNLMPLLSGQVQVNRLELTRPTINYTVYADGATNLDFLIAEDLSPAPAEPDAGSDMVIDLKSIRVQGGVIRYLDHQSNMQADLDGLDLQMSVRLGETIRTTADARLVALTIRMGGVTYLNRLAVRLRQESDLNLEGERLEITRGTLGIRGLDLDLTGSIAGWSQERMQLDLALKSASDNFGTLLELVPDAFREHIQGVQTRGSLTLTATIQGEAGDDVIPDFRALIMVEDGFLKHPQADQPVEQVQIDITADNQRVDISRFSATAAGNRIRLEGHINEPLGDDPVFHMSADASVDLATIESFFPVSDFGVELSGRLSLDARADGRASAVEQTLFNADLTLENGYFRYLELPTPVQDIQVSLNATQQRIQIQSMQARASQNTISMNGTISDPLDSLRTAFDLNTVARMDLATISEFYPIDEDTLALRGVFSFDGSARGRLAALDQAAINGELRLRDGYLKHRDIAHPVTDVQLDARLTASEFEMRSFGLRAADNRFEGRGTVRNYMRGTPEVDLTFRGSANLDQIEEFYSLEEFMIALGGRATADLRVRGPVDNFDRIRFNGSVQLFEVSVRGDSLPLPITALNADMTFSDQDVQLRQFTMLYGTSDFSFEGSLASWRNLLEEPGGNTPPAVLTATYHSRKVDVDEMVDWEEESEDPMPIELPNLRSELAARIDTLIMMGIVVTDIQGRAASDPTTIRFPEATARMYDGAVSGRMFWDASRPEYWVIHFIGDLNDLRAETFLRDFNMGTDGKMHEYISGGLMGTVDYMTGIDYYFEQDTPTIVASGTFGVTRARLRGHPIQGAVADLLGASELRDMSLDTFNARFGIRDGIMTLTDMNLTSRDIGMTLNGTQNLIDDRLDYKVQLRLPERYSDRLATLITAEGVAALRNDDNIVILPLAIVGTSENPRVTVDRDLVQQALERYLRGRGQDALEDAARRLIRGLQRN
jgi:uncharacterized protein YhdP